MISDKTLVRVYKYTDDEVNEALNEWENKEAKKPVKEELGGDYYYRCPWIACNSVLKSEDNFCPKCGQKINWKPY